MLHRHGGRPGERRTARRFAKRAQVRYWVQGMGEPRNAYIHDISTSGVFISTPYPLPRDTAIRIEIRDDDGTTYTVEAMVSRRVWVAPDLRQLGPTGMGARFMAPEEVIMRLRERGAGRVAGAKQREDHFRIVLEDDQALLRTYARDLDLGGLFIPTDVPPALNRTIHVDFQFPGSDEVCGFTARVVQRVPPGQSGGGLHAGVAVVFDDPVGVLDRLRPYLSEGTGTAAPKQTTQAPSRGDTEQDGPSDAGTGGAVSSVS